MRNKRWKHQSKDSWKLIIFGFLSTVLKPILKSWRPTSKPAGRLRVFSGLSSTLQRTRNIGSDRNWNSWNVIMTLCRQSKCLFYGSKISVMDGACSDMGYDSWHNVFWSVWKSTIKTVQFQTWTCIASVESMPPTCRSAAVPQGSWFIVVHQESWSARWAHFSKTCTSCNMCNGAGRTHWYRAIVHVNNLLDFRILCRVDYSGKDQNDLVKTRIRLQIWYNPCIIRQYIHSKTAENHVLFCN